MKKILLFISIIFTIFSCGTDENPIPDYRVYLKLDLTFEDKILRANPSYKIYTAKNINPTQGESAGYGGVLVVHTSMGEYRAFDAACPHEAKASIRVEVDNEILYAICPVCGTQYDIGFGTGAPTGIGKHFLKSYNVRINGNTLIITN